MGELTTYRGENGPASRAKIRNDNSLKGEIFMKLLLWIYAVTGTLYFLMYSAGVDPVVRYATGPLWLLMVASPPILFVLIVIPIARRLGFL